MAGYSSYDRSRRQGYQTYRSFGLPEYNAGSAAPARHEQSAPRFTVVPGRAGRSDRETISPTMLFVVRAIAVVFVVAAVLSFVRIALNSASVAVSMESSEISQQITDLRSEGTLLEVRQSALTGQARLREAGTAQKMSAPAYSETIVMGPDPVAMDSQGNLSLSESIRRVSGVSEG